MRKWLSVEITGNKAPVHMQISYLGVSHGSMVLQYFKATFIYHRRKPATEAEQSPQVVEVNPY